MGVGSSKSRASRPAFSTPYLQNHTKNGLLVGAGSQSCTPSLSCTTNTIRQSSSNGFVAASQTPPFSAAVETTRGYRSNYPIILSVDASNDPAQLRIVMVLDQNSPTACMERRPVVFTVPLERRLKKIWGLLHEIPPRTALSKPMRRPEDT